MALRTDTDIFMWGVKKIQIEHDGESVRIHFVGADGPTTNVTVRAWGDHKPAFTGYETPEIEIDARSIVTMEASGGNG